jgi:DNA-binding SARP family transcriptional activator/tetratricopeptide (TPR) repeat protein
MVRPSSGDLVQVRLLGPVDVVADGAPLQVGGLRRRAVLAVLALHGGEVVGTDELVSAVWGDTAPPRALNTVQSHVSGLRTLLGTKAAIVARPPGYVLDLGPDGVDVGVAGRLVRQGEQAADPADAARYLHEALTLWRGRPLADLGGLAWFDGDIRRLEQTLLHARETLVQARLELGQHAQLIPELEELTRQHPLHEGLRGQLMLALYRAGRQTDALAAFQRIRQILLDEHGVDPGAPLQDLHAAVLRHDPGLVTTSTAASAQITAPGVAPVPAQLPLAAPSFTGRRAELALLDELLPGGSAAADDGEQPPATSVCVVSGPAGVGKTALVVHWGHQAAARFPDGQLYVNLRGFGPGGAALAPADAVRGLLDAFAMPPERIPAGPDAQVALYRSLLAGKRMLIVLDNAIDVQQVRPLLPGTPGCLAIVTSRHQLTGLVATDAARPLTLDLPAAAEARAMVIRRLGADRVSAEPGAVAAIIDRCGRLPLALALVAARAVTFPQLPLARLADDLSETARSLDAFRSGDATADIRAVFSWSYRKLGAEAARLFRLLGLHPGPAITVPAAASLAGLPSRQTRQLLAELTRVHLLAEETPGRYSCHDLLSTYAAELARDHDVRREREAALDRMLDHYLATALAAARLLSPHRQPLAAPAVPVAGVTVQGLTTTEDALAWLGAERSALLAATGLALRLGRDTRVWQLAWAMSDFLSWQCHWPDQHAVHLQALGAAERLADDHALAYSHRGLGAAEYYLGRLDEALAHFQRALQLYAQLGDHAGQGVMHVNIAELFDARGDYADALRHSEHAFDQYQAAGHRVGQARALNGFGWFRARLGDYTGLPHCERAFAMLEEEGNLVGAAHAMDSIAYIHRQLGDHRGAIASYQQAHDLYRQGGEADSQADALTRIGDIHRDNGDPGAARAAWQRALAILTQLSHPGAGEVRARLARH